MAVANLLLAIFGAPGLEVQAQSTTPPLGRSVSVPLDHDRPGAGRIELYYELAAPFDSTLPTVLMIGDGQQFGIRRGRVAEIASRRFGPGVNVVGIPGRGADSALIASLQSAGGTDWMGAYRLLRSYQWCADLDAVRRDLLGNGSASLSGGSGGAYLALECLATHPNSWSRAYLEAAPYPGIERTLVVSSDFWSEISESDALRLREGLAKYLGMRQEIITTLSRQHYFHSAQDLPTERSHLIAAIARQDTAAVRAYATRYQVYDILALLDGEGGPAIRVREFELQAPLLPETTDDPLSPTVEMGALMAAPLIDLAKRGAIEKIHSDPADLERVTAEVLLIGACRDDAIPWQVERGIGNRLPRARVLLVDDNHMFEDLHKGSVLRDIATAFLIHGLAAGEVKAAVTEHDTDCTKSPGTSQQ